MIDIKNMNEAKPMTADEIGAYIVDALKEAEATGAGWNFHAHCQEFTGNTNDGYRWGMVAGIVFVVTTNPTPTLLDPKIRNEGPAILCGKGANK